MTTERKSTKTVIKRDERKRKTATISANTFANKPAKKISYRLAASGKLKLRAKARLADAMLDRLTSRYKRQQQAFANDMAASKTILRFHDARAW